jgi:6-phosphogluconolactonase
LRDRLQDRAAILFQFGIDRAEMFDDGLGHLRHKRLVEPNLAPKAGRETREDLSRWLPLNDRGIPRFDLIILGMGPDGHIASLFPDSKALDETTRWVIPTLVTKLCTWRITLSFPVLNAATRLALLVTGDNKSNVIVEILRAGYAPAITKYPVQRLQPTTGIDWFLDPAAAAEVMPT